jgi:hypothetical protein
VVVSPGRVREVNLDDRDVTAGNEPDDLGTYSEQDRFALVRRPFIERPS